MYVCEGQIARGFVIKHGYADGIFGPGGEFHEERLTRYSLLARVRRRRENGSRNRIIPRQDDPPAQCQGTTTSATQKRH